ncbi:MAG: DUF6504 family protein [Kiritimatiellae bacterium]|nr:DUF6504 family protein [Kiritimatiellia bacterium]
MKEQFISEEIKPVAEGLDFSLSAPGEPALPMKFRWRDEVIEIAELLSKEKVTGPCTHGSGERYVQKHCYDIRTKNGRRMRIYFDRTHASKRNPKKRWWLFSIVTDDASV